MADVAAADQPRRVLEEVLARPEFHRPGEEPSRWLQDLLERLFGVVESTPEWAGTVVTVGILVLAVLLIASVLRERATARRRRRRAAVPEISADSPAPPSAAAFYRAAREADAAGRFPDAVVLFFRAMIARLVERGFLLEDPSRTNREHARDLRARPEECALLLDALPAFEGVRYGGGAADAEDARRAAVIAARLFPEQPA